MNSRDESFQPESLEERINDLTRTGAQSEDPASPDARLINDLRHVYTGYTLSGQRVWRRLAEHMAQHDEASSNLQSAGDARLYTERFPFMHIEEGSVEQFNTRPLSGVTQSHKPGRMFTLAAVLLVAALLVGSTFWALAIRDLRGNTVAISHSPTPQATHPLLVTPTLTPSCPQMIYNEYTTLCQNNQFQMLNEHKMISGNKKLTIVAGYADANNILIWSHTDWNAGVIHGTLTLPQLPQMLGNTSPLEGSGGPDDAGGYYQIDRYEVDNVPTTLQKLDLNLTDSVRNPTTGLPDTVLFSFSLPFHMGQNLSPNLSVTANGITITLQKVLLTATGTSMDLLSTSLADGLSQPSANSPAIFVVDTGKQSLTGGNMRYNILDAQGNQSAAPDVRLIITIDLSKLSGQWTLTISPKAVPGATAPWIFQFTVPAYP